MLEDHEVPSARRERRPRLYRRAARGAAALGGDQARDDAISIFMGVVSLLSNGAAAFLTLAMLVWAQQFQTHALPLTVSTLIACFILDDLRYYLHHRIAHRCRWPWAMHIIHHSSQRFSFAVALRQGWTKHFTGTTVLKIPLVLIGFDPLMVIFCGGFHRRRRRTERRFIRNSRVCVVLGKM